MKLAIVSVKTPESVPSEVDRCRFDSKVLAWFGLFLMTISGLTGVFCLCVINYGLFAPASETEMMPPDCPPSATPRPPTSQAAELIETSAGWGIVAIFLLVWGQSIRFRAMGRGREADLHERVIELEGRIKDLNADKQE